MLSTPALSYRWYLNEFPNFLKPEDGRWFVSQLTGNLYLARAEPNDTGNYFCFTTINLGDKVRGQPGPFPTSNPRFPSAMTRHDAEEQEGRCVNHGEDLIDV